MKRPILSVLILVLEQRRWQPLVKHVQDQIDKLRNPSSVEILLEKDKGKLNSGVKRQTLVDKARGEYYCFLDDDDWTQPNYISSIIQGCKSGADVVTFILETFPVKTTRRRLNKEFWKFGLYKDNRHAGLMTANHLCAWKATIARKVGWCPFLGYGDDQLWYKPLHAAKLAKTCYHIDEPLYQYRLNLDASVNQSLMRKRYAKNYFGDEGVRCYWRGKEIVIESRSVQRNYRNGKLLVINSQGKEVSVPGSELKYFAMVNV